MGATIADVDMINHGKTNLVGCQSRLMIPRILSASSIARRVSCPTDHKKLKAYASRVSSIKTTVLYLCQLQEFKNQVKKLRRFR